MPASTNFPPHRPREPSLPAFARPPTGLKFFVAPDGGQIASAPVGAASSQIDLLGPSTTASYVDFAIPELLPGNYGINFGIDVNKNGELDSTDPLLPGIDPLHFLESNMNPLRAAFDASVSGTSTTVTDVYSLPSSLSIMSDPLGVPATPFALTRVLYTNGGTPSASYQFIYAVVSGTNPVVQVTHLANSWDANGVQTLQAVDELQPEQSFRHNLFEGGTVLTTEPSITYPPSGGTCFVVVYQDGSTAALTAQIEDILTVSDSSNMVVSAATSGVLSWTPPTGTNEGTALDHYVLALTHGGTQVLSVALPGTAEGYTDSGLVTGYTYGYMLIAVDQYGDIAESSGSFTEP